MTRHAGRTGSSSESMPLGVNIFLAQEYCIKQHRNPCINQLVNIEVVLVRFSVVLYISWSFFSSFLCLTSSGCPSSGASVCLGPLELQAMVVLARCRSHDFSDSDEELGQMIDSDEKAS